MPKSAVIIFQKFMRIVFKTYMFKTVKFNTCERVLYVSSQENEIYELFNKYFDP